MKIGILTFWWSSDNYGQLLQCYALQKYLRDAGHDAYLIRYDPVKDFSGSPSLHRYLKALNPMLVYRYISRKISQKNALLYNKAHDRHFDDFRNKYIVSTKKIYFSYDELKADPPKADVYVVGSDQVWNVGEAVNGYVNSFFLNFGSAGTKRISYAASFGNCKENYDYPPVINLLKKLDFITCREKTGIEICKKNGLNAELVCDPTLLLPSNIWHEISVFPNKINKKYIFVYVLNNTCSFSYKKISTWAKKHNLAVVYVTGNTGYTKCNFYDRKAELMFPTINEWLGYIEKAEYVVTNSFHCAVFSLMFGKRIGVIPLTKSLSKSNSRFETLFDSLSVHLAKIEDNNYDILLNVKSGCVKYDFVEKSKDLLNKMLNGETDSGENKICLTL